MNPRFEAKKLIKKYNTNSPNEIIDNLGIYYKEKDLGKLKGVYFFTAKNKVILINKDLDYYEKLVVASHELGHAVMHPKSNCKFMQNYTLLLTDKIEIQANKFSAQLLIPDITGYEGCTYEEISTLTHIPVEIVRLRTSSN